MTGLAPPPGGRVLYCPCGNVWASLHGPPPLLAHAPALFAATPYARLRCLLCGGTIAALPASAEGARR